MHEAPAAFSRGDKACPLHGALAFREKVNLFISNKLLVTYYSVMLFDTTLFQALNRWAGKAASLDFVGIFLARYLAYFLIIAFVFFLFLERNWKVRLYEFLVAALAIIFSRGIFTEALRFFFYRSRPPAVLNINALIPLPDSASFPSGHAAVFFALAATLFFLRRRWGWWFLAGAIAMGAARVFTGVHWPSDILGGAVVGILSAALARKLLPESFRVASTSDHS